MLSETVGLLKIATIMSVDSNSGTMDIRFDFSESSVRGNTPQLQTISLPYAMCYNNGLFIGAVPTVGSSVIVGQGSGNQFFVVQYLPNSIEKIPFPKENQLLISSSTDSFISLDISGKIEIGASSKNITIDNKNHFSNFDTNYYFNQGSKKTSGLIKRDIRPNVNYGNSVKLDGEIYEKYLVPIGIDPNSTATLSKIGYKNPTLTENRELIYEAAFDSDVQDDFNEAQYYSNNKQKPTTYSFPDRRKSKTDTLSLTQLYPNHLMETVKGTVVDIFGNILDLNRQPLKINEELSLSSSQSNKSQTYIKLKAEHRRGLAYHFEINTKKDFIQNGKIKFPDIHSNDDWSRARSRLFVDIDKEGQTKINIPASSETGNIALLTRYENYSSFSTEDNNNPNKLIFREDNLDIFQDSFAAKQSPIKVSGSPERGVISIKTENGDAFSKDRITGLPLKHGTAYHDLLNTAFAHQSYSYTNYTVPVMTTLDFKKFPLLKSPVKDTLYVSGPKANAGGRSLSANFDGSIDLNIGANSSDRQSILLDTAGGIIGNIGRDLNNNSGVISMDGNLILQVGSFGITGDTRFDKLNNGLMGAVLDLRVMTSGGFVHMVRIDDNGITIATPQNMKVFSKGNMTFESAGTLAFNAETVLINNRVVNKFPIVSI